MNWFTKITIISCLFISVFASNLPASLPAPGAMPELSEAELQQLEKQMEAEINQFVQTLPPEQQEQFYRDVEALTEAMSQMSEDELTQFVESVFTEPTEPVTPAEAVKPAESTQPIEKQVEDKKPKLPKSEMEAAVKLLESIFDYIDTFIQKTELISEFNARAAKWGKKGFIPGWPSGYDWDTVLADIIRLQYKLVSLLSKDPKTKKYRFIDEFVKDKALYNNLVHLEKLLSDYIPKIDLPEFGFTRIDLASKTAIRNTISSLIEAYTLKKIPDSIDKVIATFGPIAEKIKQEEAAAVAKAIQALQLQRIPEGTRIVGLPDDGYAGGIPGVTGYQPPYQPTPYKPTRRDEKSSRTEEKKKPGEKDDKKTAGTVQRQAEQTREEKNVAGHLETLETSLSKVSDALDTVMKMSPDTFTKFDGESNATLAFGEIKTGLNSATGALGGILVNLSKIKDKSKIQEQMKKIITPPIEKINNFRRKFAAITAHPGYGITRVEQAIDSFDRALKKHGVSLAKGAGFKEGPKTEASKKVTPEEKKKQQAEQKDLPAKLESSTIKLIDQTQKALQQIQTSAPLIKNNHVIEQVLQHIDTIQQTAQQITPDLRKTLVAQETPDRLTTLDAYIKDLNTKTDAFTKAQRSNNAIQINEALQNLSVAIEESYTQIGEAIKAGALQKENVKQDVRQKFEQVLNLTQDTRNLLISRLILNDSRSNLPDHTNKAIFEGILDNAEITRQVADEIANIQPIPAELIIQKIVEAAQAIPPIGEDIEESLSLLFEERKEVGQDFRERIIQATQSTVNDTAQALGILHQTKQAYLQLGTPNRAAYIQILDNPETIQALASVLPRAQHLSNQRISELIGETMRNATEDSPFTINRMIRAIIAAIPAE